MTKIHPLQRAKSIRPDHLHWLTFTQLDAGAQHFMPPHDLCQRPFQRALVQLPAQPQRQRQVVGRVLWFQLVQQP